MQNSLIIRAAASVSLVLAAGLFTACDRRADDRTAGQKVDEAVARTERKAEEIKADAKAAGKGIEQTTADLADSAALKAKDFSITTQVNAQLTRDTSLSALSINVDTTAGRVLLKGTAPDEAARERAATLAKAVEGVVSVTNELTVKPAK
jgi:hyperosmotically inducible periplasmic protein